MSERLEESLTNSGHEVSSVGKIVKQQFIALVEGQFVQRVSPCNSEVDVAQNGAQETGGIKTTTSENKFVLPSNIEGTPVLINTHLIHPPTPPLTQPYAMLRAAREGERKMTLRRNQRQRR